MTMASPGRLVKQAREATGLSQAELAERMGTTQSAVARLESAGANPRLDTLKRVVAATGYELTLGLDRPMGIDETLIAESLKRSHPERLRDFESFYRSAKSLGSRAFAARGS